MDGKQADLVLEGAGVKGIGLVGAVATLAEAGYRFPRVAGTSAGAVVAAYVVALQRAGEPLSRLEDIARSLNYAKMRDRGVFGRAAGPLARVVDGLSLAFDGGVFEGDYLRAWVAGSLADLGVRTFGDLRVADDGSSLPEQRYSLVVMASDVSRKRTGALALGLSALRPRPGRAVGRRRGARVGVDPVLLRAGDLAIAVTDGRSVVSTMVDGGVLSNFPIAMFDRTDGAQPRWPTFGVRLSMRHGGRVQTAEVRGTVSLALSLVETMLEACDARTSTIRACRPAASSSTPGVSPVDFGISEEQQEQLAAGRARGDRSVSAGLGLRWLPAHLPRVRGGTGRRAQVLVPYAEWAEDMPPGVDVDVYDGRGSPPARSTRSSCSCPVHVADNGAASVIAGDALAARRADADGRRRQLLAVRPRRRDPVQRARRARRVDGRARRRADARRAARASRTSSVPQDRGPLGVTTARPSLADRTVLIVGYGSVGAAVEARLAGFECTVAAVARRARDGVELVRVRCRLAAARRRRRAHRADDRRDRRPGRRGLPGGDARRRAARQRRPRPGRGHRRAPRRADGGRLPAALDVTDPGAAAGRPPAVAHPGVLISPHVGGNTSAFLPRAAPWSPPRSPGTPPASPWSTSSPPAY